MIMSDYVVYDEQASNRAEFSCQTDEISLEEVDTQTVEEALPNRQHQKDESSEMEYWKTIVENQKIELERIKMINAKMEAEKLLKSTQLEEKQLEYKRIYDLAEEKLASEQGEEDESVEDGADK